MRGSTIPTWRQRAEELFFIAHKKINDIAAELGMSRKAVSAHLKTCVGFADEKRRRKAEHSEKRKEYQTNWDKTNRSGEYNTPGLPLRERHELDVRILSRECYFPNEDYFECT